jgi:hypothetical protein
LESDVDELCKGLGPGIITVVVVRLVGGLGNQMFQYAAARRIASVHDVPLKLDISWFESDHLRAYKLEHLHINAAIASPDDIARTKGRWCTPGIAGRAARFAERLKPYYRRSWVRQRHLYFDPNILRVPHTVYLDGYWQSEKYFRDIEHILRQEFTIKSAIDPQNEAMARKIRQTNSVSLHIRRGDYVSNVQTHQLHGVCSLEYYTAAVEKLGGTVEKPHFFVFSDDPQWAQQNLKLEYPVTFVTCNDADKDYEDLRLMSLCQHHIIANSSFSWWGAWLCTNPEKIVIAPQKWFNTTEQDTRDLIPAAWHRL